MGIRDPGFKGRGQKTAGRVVPGPAVDDGGGRGHGVCHGVWQGGSPPGVAIAVSGG